MVKNIIYNIDFNSIIKTIKQYTEDYQDHRPRIELTKHKLSQFEELCQTYGKEQTTINTVQFKIRNTINQLVGSLQQSRTSELSAVKKRLSDLVRYSKKVEV